MARSKTVMWTYGCDALDCPELAESFAEVANGDPCNTVRGTVVHDQADADAHARTLGWQLTHGGKQTFCPMCTGRGGEVR